MRVFQPTDISDGLSGPDTENQWNPFLRERNMELGLYRLPVVADGDTPLVHPFDEVHIVLSGVGRLEVSVGSDQGGEPDAGDPTPHDGDLQSSIDHVRYVEGSVVFVPANAAHRLSNLTEDSDVLILWMR